MSRRVEYAMLEAVGMTKKAQRRSICIEGAVYAGFSIVAGTLLGALISVLLIRPFSDVMWFATYNFTLTPIFFMIPVMLTLMLAIPFVIYKRVMRESVVERIRAVNI
ncbi:MAG: FtsX-like permease family protein, partial [Lachnospiraceae bacterium]|nr:FtsX-like permease family protein [Lachnospiraceae bacterium]